jgi:hypothetical protein
MLTTFISAFAFAGVGLPESAEAWRRWGRPHVRYYEARPRVYYRSYYAPRVYRPYYRGYHYGYYGAPDYYYYGPGVSVSVGF